MFRSVGSGSFLIPAIIRASLTLSPPAPSANFITLAQVVGGVGSGKSSLISALIGAMVKRSGTVRVGGSIAYVAQSSWIMNDTLRENVLMGHTWDEDRSGQCGAVWRCGLAEDKVGTREGRPGLKEAAAVSTLGGFSSSTSSSPRILAMLSHA